MTIKRGDVWLANLNPAQGSEQAGTRPVIIFQKNTRRAVLPTCFKVPEGEGVLNNESVALCHQLRVLDKGRLQHKLGSVSKNTLEKIENCVLFTMGMI